MFSPEDFICFLKFILNVSHIIFIRTNLKRNIYRNGKTSVLDCLSASSYERNFEKMLSRLSGIYVIGSVTKYESIIERAINVVSYKWCLNSKFDRPNQTNKDSNVDMKG